MSRTASDLKLVGKLTSRYFGMLTSNFIILPTYGGVYEIRKVAPSLGVLLH